MADTFFLSSPQKKCFLTNKSCDNNFILFDKKLLCIIIVSHSLFVDPKQNSSITGLVLLCIGRANSPHAQSGNTCLYIGS